MWTSPHPPRSASATSSQGTSLSGPRSCRVSARGRGGAPGPVDGVLLLHRAFPPPRRGRCDVAVPRRRGIPAWFPSRVRVPGEAVFLRVSACVFLCVLIVMRGNALVLHFRPCDTLAVATSRRLGRSWALGARGLGPALTSGSVKGVGQSPSVGPRGPSLLKRKRDGPHPG